MIKERKNGVCRIAVNTDCLFINSAFALLAAQAIQLYIAQKDLLSNLKCDFLLGIIELTIHLEGTNLPQIPKGYLYSSKELHSHEYYNNYTDEVRRVRIVQYSFRYNSKTC